MSTIKRFTITMQWLCPNGEYIHEIPTFYGLGDVNPYPAPMKVKYGKEEQTVGPLKLLHLSLTTYHLDHVG